MKRFVVLLCAAFAMSLSALAWAHAFPQKSSPQAGASVQTSPKQVDIWFNSTLEPLYNRLQVKDAHGKVVSEGDATVDARDPERLSVRLQPALPPGQYHVHWRVTSRDGHHTEGDFVFSIASGQ